MENLAQVGRKTEGQPAPAANQFNELHRQMQPLFCWFEDYLKSSFLHCIL
jgi:hypothetical protein